MFQRFGNTLHTTGKASCSSKSFEVYQAGAPGLKRWGDEIFLAPPSLWNIAWAFQSSFSFVPVEQIVGVFITRLLYLCCFYIASGLLFLILIFFLADIVLSVHLDSTLVNSLFQCYKFWHEEHNCLWVLPFICMYGTDVAARNSDEKQNVGTGSDGFNVCSRVSHHLAWIPCAF